MIELTKVQTKAFDLALSGEKSFILFGGAVRGGKTFWLILTFVELCSRYPGSRWVIIRESLPTLQRTTFVSFDKIVGMGLRPFIKKWNQQTHVVEFINGSQLIFFAENYDMDKELTRFAGLEANGFGGEEINELNEKTLDKMFERAGSYIIPNIPLDKQPQPLVLGTCNPGPHWVKTRVYDPWRDGTLKKRWEFIPANIDDNEFIPDSYKLSLKDNLSEKMYKRFVLGDWDIRDVQNPFAIYFDKNRHISDKIILDPSLPLYVSIDFNLVPFGAIASHIYFDEHGFHLHVVDEIQIENGSIPAMIDEMVRKWGPWIPTMTMTGDSMGNRGDISQRDNATYYEQIKRGLRLRDGQIITPANPTHSHSRAYVNYLLRYHPDVKISSRYAKNTISDLQNVEVNIFDEIIKKNRKDKNQQSDFLDCFRYLVNTFMSQWIVRHQKTLFKGGDVPEIFNKFTA